MADKKENAKEKKKKNSKASKKLDISAIALIDNLVFSKKEVWAYYKVTNRSFDFLSEAGQVGLMQRLTNAFNNIMSDRKEPLPGQIIITSVPIDIELWRDQVDTISEDWHRAPGYYQYMDKVSEHLGTQYYTHKVVYIGFRLGLRGALNMDQMNPIEQGVRGSVEFFSEWAKKAFMLPSGEISAEEEEEFRLKEEMFERNLSIGHLRGTKATAEELLLLMKRQFYPNMPAPYLDVDHESRIGEGDIVLETGSVLEKHYRWLRFEQMIEEHRYQGFRTTLSMSKFPRHAEYPARSPFLYLIQQAGYPFTAFTRFELLPIEDVKKKHDKKIKEGIDQLKNYNQGANSESALAGTPDHIVETMQETQEAGRLLHANKEAWYKGSFFIVVEAPTEKYLRDDINAIKQLYADQEINISWTAGDQVLLFLSQMPGDFHRMTSFDQIATLNFLATSGFNFSSEVGDPLFGQSAESMK